MTESLGLRCPEMIRVVIALIVVAFLACAAFYAALARLMIAQQPSAVVPLSGWPRPWPRRTRLLHYLALFAGIYGVINVGRASSHLWTVIALGVGPFMLAFGAGFVLPVVLHNRRVSR